MRTSISPHQYISFLEAFLGLTLAPRFTSQRLMADKHPSFAGTFLISLLLTIFVPFIAQVIKYRYVGFDSPEFVSTIASALTAFTTFFFLSTVASVALRLDIPARLVARSLIYSLTPLNLTLWLVYIFNYIYSDRLTVVSYILTGTGDVRSIFFGQLPLVFLIAIGWVMLVAHYCIDASIESYRGAPTSLLALLLVPIMLISVGAGLLIGDMVRPGFLITMSGLLRPY